jgi:hypothetical protein
MEDAGKERTIFILLFLSFFSFIRILYSTYSLSLLWWLSISFKWGSADCLQLGPTENARKGDEEEREKSPDF